MRALLIPANGDTPTVKETTGSLTSLQAMVGGYIEPVAFDTDEQPAMTGATAYVNDAGKIRNFPRNRNLLAIKTMRPLLVDGDYIAGDMVVLGFSEDGDGRDVPNAVLGLLGLSELVSLTDDANQPITAKGNPMSTHTVPETSSPAPSVTAFIHEHNLDPVEALLSIALAHGIAVAYEYRETLEGRYGRPFTEPEWNALAPHVGGAELDEYVNDGPGSEIVSVWFDHALEESGLTRQ